MNTGITIIFGFILINISLIGVQGGSSGLRTYARSFSEASPDGGKVDSPSEQVEGQNEKSEGWFETQKPEYGKCHHEKLLYPQKLHNATKSCAHARKKSEDSGEVVKNARKGPTCEAECIWRTIGYLDDENDINYLRFQRILKEEFDGSMELNMYRIMKQTRACKIEIPHDIEDNIRCKGFKKFFACVYEVRKANCKDKQEHLEKDKEKEEIAAIRKELVEADKKDAEKLKRKRAKMLAAEEAGKLRKDGSSSSGWNANWFFGTNDHNPNHEQHEGTWTWGNNDKGNNGGLLGFLLGKK